jgi:malonyl-CoA O-methyltransferase
MKQPSDLVPSSEPHARDRLAVRRQFDRRVAWPDPAAFLVREVASRMFERLDLIRLDPRRVLDVGCGLAEDASPLWQRYPEAQILGMDLSPRRLARAAHRLRPANTGGWLQRLSTRWAAAAARGLGSATSRGATATEARERGLPTAGIRLIAADAHQLPLADQQVDLVWSNLALHWFDDVPAAIAEWHRVIRPGGLVMFSALGVDTLQELRPLGLGLPRLPDLHDLGDALVQAGFADPVMDAERIQLSWRDPRRLLVELRALGGDVRPDRPRGLATPAAREALIARLEGLCGPSPAPITVELLQGHAWCPAVKRAPRGWSVVNFQPRGAPSS